MWLKTMVSRQSVASVAWVTSVNRSKRTASSPTMGPSSKQDAAPQPGRSPKPPAEGRVHLAAAGQDLEQQGLPPVVALDAGEVGLDVGQEPTPAPD